MSKLKPVDICRRSSRSSSIALSISTRRGGWPGEYRKTRSSGTTRTRSSGYRRGGSAWGRRRAVCCEWTELLCRPGFRAARRRGLLQRPVAAPPPFKVFTGQQGAGPQKEASPWHS